MDSREDSNISTDLFQSHYCIHANYESKMCYGEVDKGGVEAFTFEF